MSTTPITTQQLIDAATDADSLAQVINSETDTTITTRQGAVIRTLFGAIQEAIALITAEAGTITANTPIIVTPGATPVADMSAGFTQSLTLTSNSSFDAHNGADGQVYYFVIKCMGFNLTWSNKFAGALDINALNGNNGNSSITMVMAKFDAASGLYFVMSQVNN